MQFLKNKNVLLLVIVIIVGGMLRFTNLNWDSYLAFHPDERNIAWAVTRIHFFDQMNPKFFAYGGLPIYLYRLIAEALAFLTKDLSWLAEWGKIVVLGRYVSAILSTISLYLISLVGSLYFSPTVGLLSAALLAFSPWAIREAHFATTETSLVFFLLMLLLLSYHYMKNPSRKTAIQIGYILGLAIGAKTTSLLFALIPFTAFVSVLMQRSTMNNVDRMKKFLINGFLCLATAEAVFLLVSPYTILDWNHFKESMQYETGVALGNLQVPYTLQFLHTTPYLYQLQTMLWQAGPVAIIGIIGLLVLSVSFFQTTLQMNGRRGSFLRSTDVLSYIISPIRIWFGDKTSLSEAQEGHVTKEELAERLRKKYSSSPIVTLVFLIFPLVYGIWSGGWFAKFARYTVPFLPFATIAAAWLMVTLYKKKPKYHIHHLLLSCSLAFLLVLHITWGVANWTIFIRPQTRIEASKWIFQHVPTSAMLYSEHWNDGLPVEVDSIPHQGYNRETLTVYEPDSEAKLTYYLDKLTQGDFIILSTRRIWATMPYLQKKYPLTSQFYEKLLNGSLGYKEEASFTAYPSLFGITINDDASEESIQVFDHPTVRIFQNKENLSGVELRKRLHDEKISQSVTN